MPLGVENFQKIKKSRVLSELTDQKYPYAKLRIVISTVFRPEPAKPIRKLFYFSMRFITVQYSRCRPFSRTFVVPAFEIQTGNILL